MLRKIQSQYLIIELDKVPHLIMKVTDVLIQEISASLEKVIYVIVGSFIQTGLRKARLHSLISGVACIQCFKETFRAANLTRCFTLLKPESSKYFFHMDKALVGAVNCKQFNNINPMPAL